MTRGPLNLPGAHVFDARICDLGEGAFWHPVREQFFWFDIPSGRLLSSGENSHTANTTSEWQFDFSVSAAAWIDEASLLIAREGALLRFDIGSGRSDVVADLDCAGGRLRSNDGRADPQGGFWIGTMGKSAEYQAGAIWRFYKGEMRCLFDRITIPNAICFSTCGTGAFFTDTVTRKVMRQNLDKDGWPKGESEVFLDLGTAKLNPDGAVIDSEDRLWIAQWGAARVAVYDRDAAFAGAISIDAPHASCPAFGGAELSTLFITSAREGMDDAALESAPKAGMTFASDLAQFAVRGQAEHRVIL